MAAASREPWLADFRRALTYLRPHRRGLIIGLLAAVGVSLFYTFSISAVVPILKIIFAEHESLVDWMHRAQAARRLTVTLAPDLPDDPAGLRIDDLRPESPNADQLTRDARIVAFGDTRVSSFDATRILANHPDTTLAGVHMLATDGTARAITLTLRPQPAWWPAVRAAAQAFPVGRTPADRYRTLSIVMAAFVLAALLGGICRFVNDGLVAVAVQRALHDLRTQLAGHTLRLPLAWHASQPPGDTLARFANDINKVQVGVSTLFGKVIREPLKAIGVLTLTLLFDAQMLVIGLIGLPVGILVLRTFGRLVKRAQRRASQSWGRLLDHLGERLAGIRVVKASNMQSAETRRFEQEGRELTRAQTHIELVDAASNPALEILAALAISAFVLYGGARVFNRELEPHLLFGAVICLGGIFDPLRKMGNVNNRLQAAEASAARLFEVLDLPTEEPHAVATAELPRLQQTIEFRDLSFAYASNPDRPVLRDINLSVRRGQVVALVGPNGSGKTTLISLLMRFFAPTRGQILIDGADIAGFTLDSLRRQIGLVTQEAIVFSDTVRANIAYGTNGVSTEQIERAARLAHVDDFVRDLTVELNGSVTRGYDAWISGRTLSGGQRQRIVLARAILRDPPILILDEATSQVDSESERKIQAALEDVTRNRTTFIIAHRFSTIARADLTVVLDDGRIVGLGRHAELLASCPVYDTLVKTQFAGGIVSPASGT